MKEWFVRWLLGGFVREVAEGKRGEGLRKVYWWLSGRKRTWSALAGLAFAGLTAYRPELAQQWAGAFVLVLGFMVTIGIADKDWKTAPPPVEWGPMLQTVMSFGPAASAFVAFLVSFLGSMPDCPECAALVPRVREAAAVVAAVTTWLAARFAVPPVNPARRAGDLK